MNEVVTDRNQQIDEFEHLLLRNFDAIETPIRSFFTDGLYAREMTAYEGTFLVSKIHKTDHIYVLSKGKLLVSVDDGDAIEIEAPFLGITKAGTRRVAYVMEDIVWTCFHANPDNETEEEIEERIIEKHDNHLLTEEMKNKMLSVKTKSLTI